MNKKALPPKNVPTVQGMPPGMMGGSQSGQRPGGGIPSIQGTDFVSLVNNMIAQYKAEYGEKLFDRFVSEQEIADLVSAAKAANQEQAEKLEALRKELAALKAGLEDKMHQALKTDELQKAKEFQKLIGNVLKFVVLPIGVLLLIVGLLFISGVVQFPFGGSGSRPNPTAVVPVGKSPASSSASSTLSPAPAGAVKPCPVAGEAKGEVFKYSDKAMKSSPPAAGVVVKYVAGDQVTYLNVIYCPVTANGFSGFYVKK